jgi:hypothetical protein
MRNLFANKECSMKRTLTITAILGLLLSITSCQLFNGKQNAERLDLLPLPDMVGIPPDKSVKNWVKFDLFGTMNNPFTFLWFSPQSFEREYPNVLIKLEQNEYDQFKLFVRANECEKDLDNVQGDPILTVTEYADSHQMIRCVMPPDKACEYMAKMYALPHITWAEEQTKKLQLVRNNLRCNFLNNKFRSVKY